MDKPTSTEPYLVEAEMNGEVYVDKNDDVNAAADMLNGEEEDLAQAYVHRMNEERAAWVAKRRETANPAQKMLSYVIPYGSLLSSGINLASSTIGGGIISLPSAFERSGIIMAFIYMVICAGLTVYSFTLLAIAGEKTGIRNYEMVVRVLMGRGADYFLAVVLFLLSFGAEIAYALSIRDVTATFLDGASSTPAYLKTDSGHRLIAAMLWLGFMLPLCLPKEINTLRYLSFIAIIFIIFFVICMVVHSGMNGLQDGGRGDYVLFQHGNKAVTALGTFMFSFGCQINAYEVHAELFRASVRRMTLSAAIGVVLSFCIYALSGLFGYLDFGASIADRSSLQLYDPIKEPLFAVCYVGMMLKLCVGYGMHMYPVRDAVYYFCGTNVHRVPWWLNCIVCTILATATLICGLFIPKINLVFGLMGAFCSGFVGFVFPAWMFMYTGNWHIRTVGVFHYFGTYFLLLCGVIGIVWGTAGTIYGDAVPGGV